MVRERPLLVRGVWTIFLKQFFEVEATVKENMCMYPSYAIMLNLHWLTAVTTSRGSNNFAKSSCDETLKSNLQRPDISGLLDAATQRISCAFRQGCALSHSICDQASLGHKWSQIRAMTTVIMSSLLFIPKNAADRTHHTIRRHASHLRILKTDSYSFLKKMHSEEKGD